MSDHINTIRIRTETVRCILCFTGKAQYNQETDTLIVRPCNPSQEIGGYPVYERVHQADVAKEFVTHLHANGWVNIDQSIRWIYAKQGKDTDRPPSEDRWLCRECSHILTIALGTPIRLVTP